jgi:hypothetical protein
MCSPLVALLNQSCSPGWLRKFCKQLDYFHRHELHDEVADKKFMIYGGEALATKLTKMVEAAGEELIFYKQTQPWFTMVAFEPYPNLCLHGLHASNAIRIALAVSRYMQ